MATDDETVPGFRWPHWRHNPEGSLRHVGFEFEFAGVAFPEQIKAIISVFGGHHVEKNRFVHDIVDTSLGTFRIEIDAAMLKDKAYEKYLNWLGIDVSEHTFLEDALEALATTMVPYEIVTPPIPLDQLDGIEQLRLKLLEEHAEGSKASLFSAFGFHINPEVPATDAATLAQYMKAFLLLYPWIHKQSRIDISRQVTPFITEFPEEYTRLVLAPDYEPDLESLIEDYLQYNATRNRALDMLPLFKHLRPGLIEAHGELKDPHLVSARPTFHYRLPNCLIDEADWKTYHEWNLWVEVENLAARADRIQAMCQDYHEITAAYHFPLHKWIEKVEQWNRH